MLSRAKQDFVDYLEEIESEAALMRATGRCGRCHEWLRYDEADGSYIPHRCREDYIEDAKESFWSE